MSVIKIMFSEAFLGNTIFNPGSYTAFSFHVSLVFFNVKEALSFKWESLKNWEMFLNLDFSVTSSWLASDYILFVGIIYK